MNMCFSVGRTDMAVGQEGPAAWLHQEGGAHLTTEELNHNTASEDVLCGTEDNRAGGLGTGTQGQHLSGRTWLWKAGPWEACEMKSRPKALAFGTGREEATSQARAQWGRQQDQGAIVPLH